MLRHCSLFLLISLGFLPVLSQNIQTESLSISHIMRNPDWIGHSPGQIFWSENGENIYFNWNPENNPADSLYTISLSDKQPRQLDLQERRQLSSSRGQYNSDYSQKVYAKYGDLFHLDIESGKVTQITQTLDRESNPAFVKGETAISFEKDNNIYIWEIASGTIHQLTNFKSGQEPSSKKSENPQRNWLQKEEQKLIQILHEREEENELRREARKIETPQTPRPYYYGNAQLQQLQTSPDGRFVSFRLQKTGRNNDLTSVPNYITSSAYTDELRARPKVGSPQPTYESWIYHVPKDTFIPIDPANIPDLKQSRTYADAAVSRSATPIALPDSNAKDREVIIQHPVWSGNGLRAFVEVRSLDFKDRWIMSLDPNTGKLSLLDHQHDEAWIDGPGIGRWLGFDSPMGWMPDQQSVWFQSEESGYSHLYTVDVLTGEKRPLTKGQYEVFNPQISRDKKYWYYTSSEEHPGVRHFYRMPIEGGKAVKITTMEGNNQVTLSPDEKHLAIRYSSSTKPWELFLMKNKAGAKAERITHSLSEEFQAYPWREPEHITFEAEDGAKVHARLYRPEKPEQQGPAVIFVHGAGYLQNAHKWWSSYFREYMFHNFLVEQGYTVLDMDFRASAGYGRDWRTAVYRHMGSKDLSDQVDGARLLVEEYDVSPDRIGIYGGSYGGFITLMAMFTEPGVFKAGAALRPVTDWAHYNHAYTGSMLNLPQDDSLAYVRSSPIYHAEGLQDALLICHGMVDTNVHFQDVVRLTQRLIELGKENWEVAMYPMEGHGFREPSSWTDEYRRIFKLFQENLK